MTSINLHPSLTFQDLLFRPPASEMIDKTKGTAPNRAVLFLVMLTATEPIGLCRYPKQNTHVDRRA